MSARRPVVAGQFYPAGKSECIAEIKECLSGRVVPEQLPERIVAGIVPHAGWVFSGDLAGLVFACVKKVHEDVDTFVIFGASHRYRGDIAEVYDCGSWTTPLGQIAVDEKLAQRICRLDGIQSDLAAHSDEHSIEVQVPFIQYLFKEAKILPVVVPCSESMLCLGERIGQVLDDYGKTVVCIGSTDLTHYGPRYGYYPAGAGPEGIEWAKNVNDMDFINSAVAMDSTELFRKAVENASACGPGAAAVLVDAARARGVQSGMLLAHSHSSEIMMRRYNQPSKESVGYAAIIY